MTVCAYTLTPELLQTLGAASTTRTLWVAAAPQAGALTRALARVRHVMLAQPQSCSLLVACQAGQARAGCTSRDGMRHG